jgi:hypothetical protein
MSKTLLTVFAGLILFANLSFADPIRLVTVTHRPTTFKYISNTDGKMIEATVGTEKKRLTFPDTHSPRWVKLQGIADSKATFLNYGNLAEPVTFEFGAFTLDDETTGDTRITIPQGASVWFVKHSDDTDFSYGEFRIEGSEVKFNSL